MPLPALWSPTIPQSVDKWVHCSVLYSFCLRFQELWIQDSVTSLLWILEDNVIVVVTSKTSVPKILETVAQQFHLQLAAGS